MSGLGDEAERDRLLFGTGIEVDGKRVDPAGVTISAAAPSPLAGGEVREVLKNAFLTYLPESNQGASWIDYIDAVASRLAALSPEAPAREGVDVPRDEKGRTAFEIIADRNRESMMRRAGVKDQSREPLLGPPADMAVSRILLAERPEIDREAADLLAIKINDALAALTPRHEAPAEGAGDREAIARIIDPAAFLFAADELMKGDPSQFNALSKADRILALRARSSAPEARS